jgi:hypothetical protein
MQPGIISQIFRRKILSPSSGSESKPNQFLVASSKSVNFYWITWNYITKDSILHITGTFLIKLTHNIGHRELYVLGYISV